METSLSIAAESEGRFSGEGVVEGDSGLFRGPVKTEVWEWKRKINRRLPH